MEANYNIGVKIMY